MLARQFSIGGVLSSPIVIGNGLSKNIKKTAQSTSTKATVTKRATSVASAILIIDPKKEK